MQLKSFLMKSSLLALLLTSGGCAFNDFLQPQIIVVNECGWFEEGKLSCNKEKLPEGSKCSQIISRESQEWVENMNQQSRLNCPASVK